MEMLQESEVEQMVWSLGVRGSSQKSSYPI